MRMWPYAMVLLVLGVSARAPAEVTVKEQDWIEGRKLIVMRNEHLQAVVAPACGGRLVSLKHLETDTENLHQVELTTLPEIDEPVAAALALVPTLVKPDYPEHWTLTGDMVFSQTPTWDFLAVGATDLWGWLECYVDRGYGGRQGNEHYLAPWDCRTTATADEVSVEGAYVTRLPPAPLLIRRRYALRKGESRVCVRHTITNVGAREINVEYFPHICMTPGGSFDAADRFAVPIRRAGGAVDARLMPTFQNPGGCAKMLPAAPWVAYVDTAKQILIVHALGYQPLVGWAWDGKTMCSLESVLTVELAPGESRSWEGYMGIATGFTSVSTVTGDMAVDIGAENHGETLDISLAIAAFVETTESSGTLTLSRARALKPMRSIPVNISAQATAQKARMKVAKRDLGDGQYVARFIAGDRVLAEKQIDIPLAAAGHDTTETRPVLWLAPAYVPMPAYLQALCGLQSTVLASTYRLQPELLDTAKIAALAVSDVNLAALKAAQCRKIIEYLRAGGRLVVLPVGYPALEAPMVIPPPPHIPAFYRELGVGPVLGGRRNPNMLRRGTFRVKPGSVVDHPLTSGLDWFGLENAGLWRFQLGKGARVLARFDTGDPLVVENNLGKGKVIVYAAPIDLYASGWSQFGEDMDAFLMRCLGVGRRE